VSTQRLPRSNDRLSEASEAVCGRFLVKFRRDPADVLEIRRNCGRIDTPTPEQALFVIAACGPVFVTFPVRYWLLAAGRVESGCKVLMFV
jgi:hypothetical protein